MNYNTLKNYYDTIAGIIDRRQSKQFSLTEIEGMIPFERDLYIMAINHANEEGNRNKNAAAEAEYEAMLKSMQKRGT
jgi:hypothetical protein